MALRVGFRKLQGDCFKLHHRALKVVMMRPGNSLLLYNNFS